MDQLQHTPAAASVTTVSPPGARASDHGVIDLLRVDGALGIGDLAGALGVTATAVRQRLDRLMRQGLVERTSVGGRRGRPAHVYSLTEAGRRVGGDNFHDLAIVLWREIRGVADPGVRRGLLGRIGSALAGLHRDTIAGDTPQERIEGVAELLRRRNIACNVETVVAADGAAELPVLTSYTCPFPDLAEEDRGICAAERLMIENLVGGDVRLSECRLDGGSCCRFTVVPAPGQATRSGSPGECSPQPLPGGG
jgi:DeoR family suf operon transcriptional repressor